MLARRFKRDFLIRALSGNLLGDPSESIRAWLASEGLFVQCGHVRGEGTAYYVESKIGVEEGENRRMKRMLVALEGGE